MAERALVICVSVSQGNTAAVARAMAAALRADVKEPEQVDPESLGEYDVVGFGSGIYYMTDHPRLRRFIEQLPEVDGTRAFVFSTSGQGWSQRLPWQQPLESLLRDKGYDVVGTFACRGWDLWLPLRLVGGLNKGHPDAADLTHAYEFAERIAARVPVG